MTTSHLGLHLDHFLATTKEEMMRAGAALSEGNLDGFKETLARVEQSQIAQQITRLVNNSKAAVQELIARIEASAPGLKVILGGTLAGVGGAAMADAVALASALGISIISAELIAIILVMLGIYYAVPAAWQLALSKFRTALPDLVTAN
jgi:hypothetical protein